MRIPRLFALVILTLLLSGCAMTQTIKDQYQGDRYLREKQYALGEETFRESVARNPDSALANYYLGRFLLANGSTKQAAAHLQKAVTLDPRDADSLFWLGVAQGELGNSGEERKRYRQVLQIDSDDIQALTYLGNSLLASREYDEAAEIYDKILSLQPANPTALFNSALIARAKNNKVEEKERWLAYLRNYPSGHSAIIAADHLNQLGDYTFRNHTLGARTVTLRKIAFAPGTDSLVSSSLPSLDVVGTIAAKVEQGKLHVLVFVKNDSELARARATSIRNYLLKNFPQLAEDRIGISWFGQAEQRAGAGNNPPNSVRFFLSGVE